MLAQSSTQAVLRAHLEKHGHYVEVGTEFCSLEQHDDKVTANLAKNIAGEKLLESVDCRWLVATDGGRSASCKHCYEPGASTDAMLSRCRAQAVGLDFSG